MTLKELMQEVVEEYPLTLEYETDAREVWPKRWKALEDKVREDILNKTKKRAPFTIKVF